MARSRSQFQGRGLRVAAMVTPLLSSWHHQLASSLFALALGPLLNAQATGLAIKSGESIAFLGDSITAGGARGPAGYCQLVVRGLALAGVQAKMLPAGVSGHKSNQMLARLQRDVLAKNPDWMTLSCGVNDVWHGKNGVDRVLRRGRQLGHLMGQIEELGLAFDQVVYQGLFLLIADDRCGSGHD